MALKIRAGDPGCVKGAPRIEARGGCTKGTISCSPFRLLTRVGCRFGVFFFHRKPSLAFDVDSDTLRVNFAHIVSLRRCVVKRNV
jgi:hypothetical protein